MVREIHNGETPPQAPSSHLFLKLSFLLVSALVLLLLMLLSFSRSHRGPSESMSCVLFQCYWHLDTNTFSCSHCLLSPLSLSFPLLPVEVNRSNILESVLCGAFPKAPGQSQPPTWISLWNFLKTWRKKDHLISQQLSERQLVTQICLTVWKGGWPMEL